MKILPLDELIKKYRSGISPNRIGKEYGVTGETIRKRLREAGVKTRYLKESMSQLETRIIQSQLRMGSLAWNKGKTKETDERVRAYGEKNKGRIVSLEQRKRLSDAKKKHEWYSTCQKCGRKKGWSRRSRCVFCAARYRADTYPNAMSGRKISEDHLHALHSGWAKRGMNKPETFIYNIVSFMFSPYELYKYTGDGRLRIKLLNGKWKKPDFIYESERKIIEVFGRYWHRNDDPKQLIDEYKKVGWDCLVIWEDEMAGIRDDILAFTFPEDYLEEERSLGRDLMEGNI